MQKPLNGSPHSRCVWCAHLEAGNTPFRLWNIGELLFLAYFAEAPLIVTDDASRAMLRERGYNALKPAIVLIISHWMDTRTSGLLGSWAGFRSSAPGRCDATPRSNRTHCAVAAAIRALLWSTQLLLAPLLASRLLSCRTPISTTKASPPVLLAAVLS